MMPKSPPLPHLQGGPSSPSPIWSTAAASVVAVTMCSVAVRFSSHFLMWSPANNSVIASHTHTHTHTLSLSLYPLQTSFQRHYSQILVAKLTSVNCSCQSFLLSC
jgi:hypothetical protein